MEIAKYENSELWMSENVALFNNPGLRKSAIKEQRSFISLKCTSKLNSLENIGTVKFHGLF